VVLPYFISSLFSGRLMIYTTLQGTTQILLRLMIHNYQSPSCVSFCGSFIPFFLRQYPIGVTLAASIFFFML
jgi:hypothetical protein